MSLNGKSGTVVGWDSEKSAIACGQLVATGARLSPSAWCYRRARVTIRDVQAKPQLNGKQGQIQKYDYGAGQFLVKLSASEQVMLRPANLTTVRAEVVFLEKKERGDG